MREVLTFGRYLRGKFGYRVHKVPIGLSGFTCPNIDGSLAYGGCSYCENESFSPNMPLKKPKIWLNPKSTDNPLLQLQLLELEAQYNKTSHLLAKKFGAKSFLAYFQSFSNTYAPLDTLKALYGKALSLPDCIGLSIGTRSDCIDTATIDYLSELSKTSEIWVEYGVQSVHDETLRRINRAHDFANVRAAIEASKKAGLNVCAHLIFGLPDETLQMMLENVRQVIELGIDSLKLHPLYIVKNTAMANEHAAGRLKLIDEELFLSLLVEAISMLPPTVSVQRITAGISNDTLVAPLWCADKHTQIKKAKDALLSAGLVY